jgi:hypothetical protein
MIWGAWKAKYFCKWDSTRLSTNCPTGKSLEPVLLPIRWDAGDLDWIKYGPV